MVTLAASALRGAGGFFVVLALIITSVRLIVSRRILRTRGGITSGPQHVVEVSLADTDELAHKLFSFA